MNKPRILLIGCGRFGKNHLRILKQLEKEGEIILEGVVTATKTSSEKIAKEYQIKTFERLTEELLNSVDAVDIVTPASTHFEIIKKCIIYCPVLIEKPLSLSLSEIEYLQELESKHGNKIMVGHIFRFNDAVKKVKELIKNKRITSIKGVFISPGEPPKDCGALHDELHLFDILDLLLEEQPTFGKMEIISLSKQGFEKRTNIKLTYPSVPEVNLELGWEEERKERTLEIHASDNHFFCDLVKQTITFGAEPPTSYWSKEPLMEEIKTFITHVKRENKNQDIYPNTKLAFRIQKIIDLLKNNKSNQLKVGVIGAGIFGLSAALELAKFCEVKVFERNNSILSEATSQNMLRHHMGYHYPRSPETVKEIRDATPLFEEEFKECIVGGFPAYYAISKEKSMTDSTGFIKFCDENNLHYKIVEPPEWLVDKNKISLCFETKECVYDPDILNDILQKKINSNSNLQLFLDHEVVNGKKEEQKKILSIFNKNKKELTTESFDIIINATYSHFNTFNSWFGFPTPIMQYDLMEILEIEIPQNERFGLLILDGLFCTILPKGNKNTFTLGHVEHTMLKRHVAKKMEEIHKNKITLSNQKIILQESIKFMPFLKNAKVVRSMYSTRVIKPHHEHDDARPTEITDYGDGIYSIFAGKVITAVKTAREVAEKVKRGNYQ